MKQISILRMYPGVDVQSAALATFLQNGPVEGSEWTLASASSKTYITLSDVENRDIAGLATYAPFFDIETIPVVEMDEAWVTAMQAAQTRRP